MAEIKVNDLPVMSTSTLTGNDHFIVIDDDKARLMTVSDFQTWMKANVQGEKGEQGVAGRNGTNGTNGTNGANGKSAYDIAVSNGYVGSESDWIKSVQGEKGDTGATGAKGNNGYSPVYQLVTNSNGTFIQITDWVGGDGTKPATGYLSSNGVVSNINNATNIRGDKGDQGLQGVQGNDGKQGTQGIQGVQGYSAYDVAVQQGYSGTQQEWLKSLVGKPVQTINVSSTGVVKITDSSGTVFTSNTPEKETGFLVFSDSSYTQTSPLNLVSKTETALNNDATQSYKQTKNTLFKSPNTLVSSVGSYYRVITEFTCTKDATFKFKIKNGDEVVFDVLDNYVAGEVHFELDYFIKNSTDELKLFIESDVDNSIYGIKQTIVQYI
jgi:hypothetical protein